MEIKCWSTLCDWFSKKAEKSSKHSLCSTARDSDFCGQILIKGLDVVFLKAVSPQTAQKNVLDSRLRSALKYTVVTLSVKVIVTTSTPFSCSLSPGLALLLHQTKKNKVIHFSILLHSVNNSSPLFNWTCLLFIAKLMMSFFSVWMRCCVFLPIGSHQIVQQGEIKENTNKKCSFFLS